MPSCVVEGCSPAKRKTDERVFLHVFPKEKDQIRKWLVATGQKFNTLEDFVNKIFDSKSSDSHRMCSMHFAANCYRYNPQNGKKRLIENAMPTIFAPPEIWLAKRKRVEATPTLPFALQAGDCCPTCSQVIPMIKSAPSDSKTVTTEDKATTFDRSHGTRNKSVQSSVRTFSIKTQCSILRPRGLHLLAGAIPHSTDYVFARRWTQNRTTTTDNPTVQIESEPTDNPTVQIKLEPTDNPSLLIKLEPTDNPTVQIKSELTENPTLQIKLEPTDNRSLQTKSEPMDNSTFQIHSQPTDNPTLQIHSQPTDNPTLQIKSEPTDNPTLQIHSQPTDNPTLQIHSQPTDNPTLQIHSQPTDNPTLQIYLQPTLQVKPEPTDSPTTQIKSETTEKKPYTLLLDTKGKECGVYPH